MPKEAAYSRWRSRMHLAAICLRKEPLLSSCLRLLPLPDLLHDARIPLGQFAVIAVDAHCLGLAVETLVHPALRMTTAKGNERSSCRYPCCQALRTAKSIVKKKSELEDVLHSRGSTRESVHCCLLRHKIRSMPCIIACCN